MSISDMAPSTGRSLKENNTSINQADAFLQISDGVTAHRCETIEEAAVNDGVLYTGAIPVTPLTASQTIKSTFQTPANKKVVFKPILVKALTGDLAVVLYEGSSGVSGGTAYPATNRNRQSTNTSTSVITLSPTVTTMGTAIGLFAMMHSTVPVTEVLSPEPLILKANTTYTLSITNSSTSANAVAAELSFIEV